MAWQPNFGLIHHIKLYPDNRIKKTLCGRSYDKPYHNLTLATIRDGEITNTWRKLEDDEICKRCLTSYRKILRWAKKANLTL